MDTNLRDYLHVVTDKGWSHLPNGLIYVAQNESPVFPVCFPDHRRIKKTM
jgi:hypothetical protein